MKKIPKTRVQGTTWKEQMPLPNIHLCKGKYPENGKEFNIYFSYLIIILAKFMQTSQNNSTNMLWGYKQ